MSLLDAKFSMNFDIKVIFDSWRYSLKISLSTPVVLKGGGMRVVLNEWESGSFVILLVIMGTHLTMHYFRCHVGNGFSLFDFAGNSLIILCICFSRLHNGS